MSLFERISRIAKVQFNNLGEDKGTYIPFSNKAVVTFGIHPDYIDLIKSAFVDQYFGIGVQIIDPKVFYDNQGLVVTIDFNSVDVDYELTSSPRDLYSYNTMSEEDINVLQGFIKKQVGVSTITLSEAEGGMTSMIIIASITELLHFVLSEYIEQVKNDENSFLPYEVLDLDDPDSWSFEYSVNLQGVDGYADEVKVPILPPFGNQMQPLRNSILEYFQSANSDWYQFFKEVFNQAEEDYRVRSKTLI